MAEKMSTLVVKADLDCKKCYNKLRRTLCEYHYEIRSQLTDRKQNTVTISGPFDPQEFAKKLNNKAGKAIKSIEIKKKEEEKPKPKEGDKPAEKKAEGKPAEKKADGKPAEKKADDKPAEKKAEGKPAEKKADKPPENKAAEKPKKVEAPKSDPPKAAEPAPTKAAEPGPGMKYVDPGPVLAYPMVQPYGGYTVPCYEGYVGGGPVYDGYGTPLLGYDGGYAANRGYYANHGYNNYNNNNTNYGSDYFSEKDPTCSIM